MKMQKNYYLGLDIGTDSVGYAVTDEQYELLKHKRGTMWGVHLFEEASLNDERRGHRTARRRLDRRQARVRLVQEIFASEIAKVDEGFYRRIKESALWREDAHDAYCLFADSNFTDSDYHKKYPTIHHLIFALMSSDAPHDVRLVYLACAWLVAHRGHFFNDVSRDHIEKILDIRENYLNLMELFNEELPWFCDPDAFGSVLKKRGGVNAKYKELCNLLFNTPNAPKTKVTGEGDGYSTEHILKLLCGGSVMPKDLFGREEYAELSSFSLDKSDDDMAQLLGELGDDAELILRLKAVFDWAILADILEDATCISEKKVAIYEQHKKDLQLLKRMVRTYAADRYKEVFRDENGVGYAAYVKSGSQEDFCKFIKGIFKNIKPSGADSAVLSEMLHRLESNTFCPKQVTSDNRVIPYQVYWYELNRILVNASTYLPFLNGSDEEGYVAKEKLLSIMEFRVPYFVGPLNRASRFSWFERKADSVGKILPWNFDAKVDLDRSEQAFIDRMTNKCTYLPYADVLPKGALLYEKFQVLNEINCLSVLGQRISVELKQRIYLELFAERKKVTVKAIKEYLMLNGYYTADDLETLSGIDETIKSSLSSYRAFRRLLDSKQLSENDVEALILRSTYTEDRVRFSAWMKKTILTCRRMTENTFLDSNSRIFQDCRRSF